jgi:2-hydroxy-3-keto-5-methylthiopentenyl-1-phosphate phosphatase
MARQTTLLRVTPEVLDKHIHAVRIDPGFPVFLNFCQKRRAEVKIVADGFDRSLVQP